MNVTWEFRNIWHPEEEINAALCATETEGMLGVNDGWVVRFAEVVNESPDVRVLLYVEQPRKVTSTILADGTVIEW